MEQRPLNIDEENENETKIEDLNDPTKHSFVRYLNVKRMNDGPILYKNTHFGGSYEVKLLFFILNIEENLKLNGSRQIHLRPNPNFYGLPTSSESSAVHVPTPIYNRGLFLIKNLF